MREKDPNPEDGGTPNRTGERIRTEPNRAWGTGRVLLLLRDDSSEDQLQFDQTRDAKEVQMRS